MQNTRFPPDKQKYNKICKELKYLLQEDAHIKNKSLIQNLIANSGTDLTTLCGSKQNHLKIQHHLKLVMKTRLLLGKK